MNPRKLISRIVDGILISLSVAFIISSLENTASVVMVLFIAVIGGLTLWARKNPGHKLAWIFSAPWHGSRTELRFMTRKEILRSAAAFFVWALLSVIAFQNVAFHLKGSAQLIGIFLCTFSFLMGVGGALYMVLRGLLKRGSVEPRQDRRQGR